MSREAVRDYVSRALCEGFTEHEFFGLVDLGEAAISELTEQIRIISDQNVRVRLVQVLWQIRSQSALPFLSLYWP